MGVSERWGVKGENGIGIGVTLFLVFYGLLIIQRLSELWVARRHAVLVMAEGGYEVGQDHYKWIVGTHVVFFVGLLVEVTGRFDGYGAGFPLWFGLFILAQLLRYWAIVSLGRYWNTRIIVAPRMEHIRRGPYRFIPHPNYVAVVTELIVIPMMFGAYFTAVAATIINAMVLRRRIRVEEMALREVER